MVKFIFAVGIEDIRQTEAILNLPSCTWVRVKNPREMSDYDYIVTCEEDVKEKIVAALDMLKPYFYCCIMISD